jgi:hypothetical protein
LASNQTPQSYIEQAEETRGTGVFLRKGVSGESLVTFQQNLSYESCVDLGGQYLAFKWIPASVSSYSAVVDSRCKLVGERCSKSCAADGCLCDPTRQQCVDASSSSNLPPNTGGSQSGDQVDEPELVETTEKYAYGRW